MSAGTKVPLSSVVTKTTGGGTPERDNPEFWNGGIPWASVKDFKDGVYRLTKTKEEISEKGLKRSASHLIPAGTPIICTRMAVGRIARASVPLAINQDLRALHIREDFDTDYVVWAVDSIRHRIENLSIGSTVKGINIDQLLSFEIEAPSKPEQTKIAEILSTVDRAISQTEALIAKQQRLKTGLMQDLLTRGIDEHGNLRSEQTHQFKDSPLGRIPMQWEAKDLRSFLSYLSYGFTNPMPEAIDGPFLITAANVINGVVQYDTCRRTTIEAYTKLLTNKSRPRIGDILITKDGTLGRMAIVDRSPLCINQSVAVMRVKEGVDNVFLKLLLESDAYQRRIMEDSGGSTIKHIYISKIDKMVIAMPQERQEQEVLKKRLLAQANALLDLESLAIKLRTLKTALMQDLLTGRKRVTTLPDETEAKA